MAQSIKQRTNNLANYHDATELKALLDAILVDLTALRTAQIGLAAKLDDDATVTDTNYEALWTPAALTTTS
jgi:hypothetical protein